MTEPLIYGITLLQQSWLSTLVSARELLAGSSLKPHWERVKFTMVMNPVRLLDMTWVSADGDNEGFLDCKVPITLIQLPPIEQREALYYVLASVHWELFKRGIVEVKHTEFTHLCRALGCWKTNTVQIETRWRNLGMFLDISKLSYIELEDRPVCRICSGRIPTGAEYDPAKDLIYLESDAITTGRIEASRPDVHHECMRYAKLILVPGINEARRQMALEQSKEIDK